MSDLAASGQPQDSGPGTAAAAVAPAAAGPRGDHLPRNGQPENGQPPDSQPGNGVPTDEGWDRDGDDWDPAQSLAAEEIAALAALDREGDPADDWDEYPDDAAPVGVAAWLVDLQGDDPHPPPRGGPVEALPGLTPRRLGTGGGFDAGGMADLVPPGPVLAGLTADK